MAAGDLTTIQNAMDWCPGLSSTSGARMIMAASSAIQNWIGYQIASASYTKTFNGNGRKVIKLPDIPVTAVSSVTVNGLPIPVSPAPSTYATQQNGFSFDESNVYLVGYYFSQGFQNVTIAYTAGYSSTPPDIEQAALDWVKIIFDRAVIRQANQSKLQASDAGITYEDTTKVGSRLIGLMPAAIMVALQPYRRTWPTP